RMLADRYSLFRGERHERAAFHQPDLSLAFFERAQALTRQDGVLALLIPAKLLNAAYAAPLRRMAESQLTILALDDWSDGARRHGARRCPDHGGRCTRPAGARAALHPRARRACLDRQRQSLDALAAARRVEEDAALAAAACQGPRRRSRLASIAVRAAGVRRH